MNSQIHKIFKGENFVGYENNFWINVNSQKIGWGYENNFGIKHE